MGFIFKVFVLRLLFWLIYLSSSQVMSWWENYILFAVAIIVVLIDRVVDGST